ncbi:MAG TPA: acetyl/propionyl/methylcrotonyl-CoA carboxylase subunit alpha [Gammaproteobacteria bacterium]|nr:acetyl/propionyl/methylcrotonyl-CoA carboxylase subunit alpha [Gammaproteobacteria bacterium]
MFKKILIANRGEIACRVIRTAKRLNIQTVAIYSKADQHALHVKLADESYCIGAAPSSESYLCGEAIIQVAHNAQAQAIHPGYGFLSENADFAERCTEAGIVFIGPPATAIRAMGEKNTAKQLMQNANVPVIPGYHQAVQDDTTLKQAAATIGYPVLIKAVAGGGGKGMRVVTDPENFIEALNAARNEAKASFGDDRVLLEKYLQHSRHVEVQVFADAHQNAVYLFERDCSLQRRHQKIIEEAPAPGLTAELRQAMGQAAVNAAKAIHYRGAGTIEFLLSEEGSFYFMEMNTRLQVEHPITEMITRQDLVEWQLRVANGEPLPITQQSALSLSGHAFEARIYAEDPQKDFMPSTGKLSHLKFPTENANVRIDTGVTAGDSISVYYDPLIAKLITWDQNRSLALERLHHALTECQIVGVTTNLALLTAITTHPAFAAAKLDTHFIEQHMDQLLAPSKPVPDSLLALAALGILIEQQTTQKSSIETASDPHSPWFQSDSWRLNLPAKHSIYLKTQQQTFSVTLQLQEGKVTTISVNENTHTIDDFSSQGNEITAVFDQQNISGTLVTANSHLHLFALGQHVVFNSANPLTTAKDTELSQRITAPMPGALTEIFVTQGQTVKKGDRLLTVEAMKMQHTLYASADGKVKDIFYKPGDLIEEGMELISWED